MRAVHTSLRSEFQSELTALRSDMREDFAAVRAGIVDLGERVTRVEVTLDISIADQVSAEQ